ncbi:MAG: DUF2723 domain-containing protein [Ignavibacteriales bacterium]|nr:DUF2723 domain-containing protein [Ignavibacteriales bacterium]
MNSLLRRFTTVHSGTVAVFLVSFMVYLQTMARSLGFIDGGELATIPLILGIAHPSGYPLFTLLGRLFSLLPLAQEPVVQMNLFSAFLTAAAAAIFFRLTIILLTPAQKRARPSPAVLIAATTAALMLAFSQTFWDQSAHVEVYSLHLVLLMLSILTFVLAIENDNGGSAFTQREWLIFGFVLGLSFTNHLTTILLAPGFLYQYFVTRRLSKQTFRHIFQLAIPFLAGLSLYLYFPIRASQQPVLNWGNPVTLEKIWWHIGAKQYRVWMFSSSEVMSRQFNYFLSTISIEFFYFPLILAVIGAGFLLLRDRRRFLFLFLLAAGCVAYAVNYDIHDIDSYFLLAYVVVAVFAAFGVHEIVSRIKDRKALIGTAIALALLVGAEASVNRDSADEHSNYLVEDYSRTILSSVQPNALILSFQWDYFVAGSYYLQIIKHERPDVVIIDKELLRRSWYFKQLENNHPEVYNRSKAEIELFLAELFKFEHDLPYEAGAIESRYNDMINSFFDKNKSDRPLYVTSEIEQHLAAGYQRAPEGLLFRLYDDSLYHPYAPRPITIRPYAHTDKYTTQLYGLIRLMLNHREMYDRKSRIRY